MDLVAGVHKEGSRGGRGDFKWEDVRDSQHRENYLGHSLMAPVGRWQRNKDLSWYAKSDTSSAATAAAEARKEEIKRIKQAESDALSKALGYEPVNRDSDNANNVPVQRKEVEKAIRETAEGDDGDVVKGVGFGGFAGTSGPAEEGREVLGGIGLDETGRQNLRHSDKDSGDRPRGVRPMSPDLIGGIVQETGNDIGPEADPGIGTVIGDGDRVATKESEMRELGGGRGNVAILRTNEGGGDILETEVVTTEDEKTDQ
ncbi:hypothetical protein ACLMJK_001603 [Lecanora helva]